MRSHDGHKLKRSACVSLPQSSTALRRHISAASRTLASFFPRGKQATRNVLNCECTATCPAVCSRKLLTTTNTINNNTSSTQQQQQHTGGTMRLLQPPQPRLPSGACSLRHRRVRMRTTMRMTMTMMMMTASTALHDPCVCVCVCVCDSRTNRTKKNKRSKKRLRHRRFPLWETLLRSHLAHFLSPILHLAHFHHTSLSLNLSLSPPLSLSSPFHLFLNAAPCFYVWKALVQCCESGSTVAVQEANSRTHSHECVVSVLADKRTLTAPEAHRSPVEQQQQQQRLWHAGRTSPPGSPAHITATRKGHVVAGNAGACLQRHGVYH